MALIYYVKQSAQSSFNKRVLMQNECATGPCEEKHPLHLHIQSSRGTDGLLLACAALVHDLSSVVSGQLAESIIAVYDRPLHNLCIPQQETGFCEQRHGKDDTTGGWSCGASLHIKVTLLQTSWNICVCILINRSR